MTFDIGDNVIVLSEVAMITPTNGDLVCFTLCCGEDVEIQMDSREEAQATRAEFKQALKQFHAPVVMSVDTGITDYLKSAQ